MLPIAARHRPKSGLYVIAVKHEDYGSLEHSRDEQAAFEVSVEGGPRRDLPVIRRLLQRQPDTRYQTSECFGKGRKSRRKDRSIRLSR
jgi:hypothetical protein